MTDKVEDVKNDIELDTEPIEDKKEEDVVQLSDDEKLAIESGWKPKDQWEGPEDEWKPAKVFNEIGALKKQLSDKDKETKKLNKVVAMMKEHHLNVRQAAYKDAMEAIKRERQEALKAEDFAKAEALRDKMDEIKDNYDRSGTLPPQVERELREVNTTPDPAFVSFLDRNPWYKVGGTDSMSKKADALGYAYTQSNPEWSFKQVIEAVEKDIRQLYPDKFSTPRSPVNDGGSRRADAGGKRKDFGLSPEEKAMAKSFGMSEEDYAKELQSYRGR